MNGASSWIGRREAACYFGLPIAGSLIALALLPLLPAAWLSWFFSETGPVELATAALFFAAGVLGARHIVRYRAKIPLGAQVLFGLFVFAAVFVALEELSYGQHLLRFRSPEWFESHNKQHELNIHNLYGSRPSQYIRLAGSIAVPLFCIVLPLVYRQRDDAWQPGHWTHALLPKFELVAIVLLAQFATLPTKLPYSLFGRIPRLGEVKELYWSIGAVCYILLMSRRHEAPVESIAAAPEDERSQDGPLRQAA